jgi:hypothetical protein
MDQKKKWFRYVKQRLGEVSMMKRMNWDQLRISRTARRVEKKFQFARWAEMSIRDCLRSHGLGEEFNSARVAKEDGIG